MMMMMTMTTTTTTNKPTAFELGALSVSPPLIAL
jgi:hypothetical protein